VRVVTVYDRMDQSERAMNDEFYDALLDSAATVMQPRIQSITPVDTGRLRASIHSERTGGLNVEIYTDVDYGTYVEFGHRVGRSSSYVPGQYFMRRGYEQTWQLIEPHMAARMQRATI
jgi:HK97 gp10 family phage protein